MVGSDLESKSGLASRDLLDIDYEKTSKNGTKVSLMAGGAKSWNNSFVNTLETSIYELQENGFQKVEARNLSNMGTAETLSYFLNFGFERYKRVKFDLIFWNHGGAVDGNEYDQLHFNDNLKIPELKERDSLLENQKVINLKNQRDIFANANNSNNECEC